jgi:two-component system NtrC family sensor kinase
VIKPASFEVPRVGSGSGRGMGRLWLLGITMVLALGCVLGVNLYLETRETQAAFEDFKDSQVKVAVAAACVLLSNLESSPTPLPWVLRDLQPLEQPGITRLFVRSPAQPWISLDGLEVTTPTLELALATKGRWFSVGPQEAVALGLPDRTAALALSGAMDRGGRTWIVAVAGTAFREPDRSMHARWRLLASFVSMGAFLFILAWWALRFQKQELELAREIELRELGRQKDQALAQADRAGTMLTLASGVAHEIATPLGVISGRAAQLVSRMPGDERNLRLAQTIQEETEQINRTIRRFLELARGGTPRVEDFGTGDLVRAAATMVEHRFHKAGVDLVLDTPPELPGMRGDFQLLEHLLVNLLLNACDASQRGDQVEVRARTAEGRMVLEVTDQGKGIPEALAERVMEPFFTTKPQGQGTGLGLAIAREIVRMHRGELGIERLQPRGTRIRISLPA